MTTDRRGDGGGLRRSVLGRTGITVTCMGLGAGGFSRAGLAEGEDHAASIVAQALDLGVTLVDTAEVYGTEAAVGRAVAGRAREQVVVSTKVSYREAGALRSAAQLEAAADAGRRRLGLDYVDVLHLHGVSAAEYEEARDRFGPVLARLKQAGAIRAVGITEGFASDPGHRMLRRAVLEEPWDVVMVGFHLLNQSARETVLAPARARNLGVLAMFVVRGPLGSEEALTRYLTTQREAAKTGQDVDAVVARLRAARRAAGDCTLPDLAYRFARDEPGMSAVLVGTGSAAHLTENVAAMRRGPLPAGVRAALCGLPGGEATLSLQ